MAGKPYRRSSVKRPSVNGWYVYGWYDSEELFYVGRSSEGSRLHDDHGWNSRCEDRRRRIGLSFRAEVLQDGLTQIGARVVESLLIRVCKPTCNCQIQLGDDPDLKSGHPAHFQIILNDDSNIDTHPTD